MAVIIDRFIVSFRIMQIYKVLDVIIHCIEGKGKGHTITCDKGTEIRGTALLTLNLVARWGWVVNALPQLL
jgi:hypothetical protein